MTNNPFDNQPAVARSHTETVVPQLPICTACGERITFYMHQDYHREEGMHYFHPECCPSCTRTKEATS